VVNCCSIKKARCPSFGQRAFFDDKNYKFRLK
jgi:hypothetical protein